MPVRAAPARLDIGLEVVSKCAQVAVFIQRNQSDVIFALHIVVVIRVEVFGQ
jgi:hypothetical protein